MILNVNCDYFLKRINHLVSLMVKSRAFYAIRNQFLNIYTSFGFKCKSHAFCYALGTFMKLTPYCTSSYSKLYQTEEESVIFCT